jgi:hypothetical protein
MIQIRESADQIATDQTQREGTSQRLESLIADLEQTLQRQGLGDRGSSSPVPAVAA